MSIGKIVVKSRTRRENQLEQNVAEIIYQIVPNLEVDVENTEWKNADESIKKDIDILNWRNRIRKKGYLR